MRPSLQRMLSELDKFMEWPTEDHSQVTALSAAMFAEHVLDQSNNAAWLAQVHSLCTNCQVDPGHIENRLHDLIGKIDHIFGLLKKARPYVKDSAPDLMAEIEEVVKV